MALIVFMSVLFSAVARWLRLFRVRTLKQRRCAPQSQIVQHDASRDEFFTSAPFTFGASASIAEIAFIAVRTASASVALIAGDAAFFAMGTWRIFLLQLTVFDLFNKLDGSYGFDLFWIAKHETRQRLQESHGLSVRDHDFDSASARARKQGPSFLVLLSSAKAKKAVWLS